MIRARALYLLLFTIGCKPTPTPTQHTAPVTVPLPDLEDSTANASLPSGAPVSLTASDGTGLRVLSFQARAVVVDPLAYTELHLVFLNPEPRTLEGQFEITLPTSGAVSRFAMKKPSGWQEGEVVDLQHARESYEDALHRRVDPALLEKLPGNRFHARVFPIPPSGRVEIILSYSESLTHTGEPYRVHLRGLPVLERLDVSAIVAGRIVAVEKHQQQPAADFVVPLPAITQQPQIGLRNGELVVARITPVLAAAPDPIDARGIAVLFDSSASRALGYDASVRQLGALLAELGRRVGAGTPLSVRCFDQGFEACYDGTLGGFDEAAQQTIIAWRALGASNFEHAFESFAKQAGPKAPRLIVVTDGVSTAGATGAALTKAVLALRDAGVERMDMIVAGGIRDEAALTQLTTAGLARDGVVLDLARGTGALAARLMNATVPRLRVSIPGSAWVWPTELKGMQPGDQVLVYAQLDQRHPLLVDLDGTGARATHMSYPVELFGVERPLLERASIGAQIARLEAELAAATAPADAKTLWARIVELSTTHRVLCAETALLVLESEADYLRFHIDRSALTDILSVGANGVELTHRRDVPTQLPPVSRRASDEGRMGKTTTAAAGVLGVLRSMEGAHLASIFGRDTALGNAALAAPGLGSEPGEGVIGLGNLGGTIGAGYGGGTGGLGGRQVNEPDVAPGAAQVRGSIDESLIRRIVRRHLNEVRFCYERELMRKPDLAGRIAIQFTIGGDGAAGSVTAATVQQSTMNNEAVEQCVAQAVRRWEFPSPMGGSVIVTYPFVFAPSGSVDGARSPGEPREPPSDDSPPDEQLPSTPPYEGRLAEVMSLLHHKKAGAALATALKWRDAEPGDVLVLVALGEAYEQLGDGKRAARAYGSIIDLFPGRADMRRFAGERLERVGGELALAIDTFEKAREQRPDHPASHRLLAYALVRAGQLERAFSTMREGAARSYPAGRFLGVDRIMKEDLGLIAAAWIKQEPNARSKIEQLVADAGAEVSREHSLRFVLNWETDANDVDFHIFDARGGHAYYARKQLASGGELYADVTTGYGPECFAISEPSAYPYRLRAHYYSRGPMGYGMGKLEIIEHDGHGGLRFEERPFVIMVDHATVDLGQVTGSLRK